MDSLCCSHRVLVEVVEVGGLLVKRAVLWPLLECMLHRIPQSTPALLQLLSPVLCTPLQLISLSSLPIQLAFLNSLMGSPPPVRPKHEFVQETAPWEYSGANLMHVNGACIQ